MKAAHVSRQKYGREMAGGVVTTARMDVDLNFVSRRSSIGFSRLVAS
jgi:hypothetical protein